MYNHERGLYSGQGPCYVMLCVCRFECNALDTSPTLGCCRACSHCVCITQVNVQFVLLLVAWHNATWHIYWQQHMLQSTSLFPTHNAFSLKPACPAAATPLAARYQHTTSCALHATHPISHQVLYCIRLCHHLQHKICEN